MYNVYIYIIYLYRSRRANSRRLCVALFAEYTAGTTASIKNVGVSVADYRSSMLPSRNHPITASRPCRPRASVILSLRHTHEGLKKPNARVCNAPDSKKKFGLFAEHESRKLSLINYRRSKHTSQ